MTSSRWRDVKEIAAAALKLDPSERPRFLDKACRGSDIRKEVESLLGFETERFLETPPLGDIDEDTETSFGTGSRLGSYEILATLGVGGMGEVYRARDETLGREVAIKILPKAFSNVEERLERFEREAPVLASLNHPGIATLHRLEKHEGVHYLVMELVSGETLEARLERGALPYDEALSLLRQIAEALEAAHDKGVIHRDLKPANIMVTPEGDVKILDFGLAKDFIETTTDSRSPTGEKEATREGVILGAAAYMSPEQARGKPVDKRTDLWAFGCVCYETLAGKPAFSGEAFTDVIASILHSEPDRNALPAETPTKVRDLLRRCLQKDLKTRMRDIGDARIELEEASTEVAEAQTAAAVSRPSTGVLALAAALTAIVTSLTVWGVLRRDSTTTADVTRAVIPFAPDEELAFRVSSAVAISPDGRHIAYGVRRAETSELRLRALDESGSRLIARANTAGVGWMPFFSPDGQWLGFLEDGELKKVAVSGGAPVTIANVGKGVVPRAPCRHRRLPRCAGEPRPRLQRGAPARSRVLSHGSPTSLPRPDDAGSPLGGCRGGPELRREPREARLEPQPSELSGRARPHER